MGGDEEEVGQETVNGTDYENTSNARSKDWDVLGTGVH